MTVTAAGRIDVISDAICPWCYIGKRHLERALDILEQHKLRFTVAWHPFQLNPDMPAEGVDRKQYRITKFGSLERSQQMDARITEVAAGVGTQFHLDKLTRTPNTLKAHRLIRLAGQKGVQDGVVESLFDGGALVVAVGLAGWASRRRLRASREAKTAPIVSESGGQSTPTKTA